MDKGTPTNRHEELSQMFLKMGQSLVEEGLKNKDYTAATIGNSMIFISSLVFDVDELKLFNELCFMMSSSRLIRGINDGSFDISKLDGLSKMGDNPFQEILKRIKRDLDSDDTSDDK